MKGRPRGPMDKASDYESGDSRFESWRGRILFLGISVLFIFALSIFWGLNYKRFEIRMEELLTQII